MEGHGQHHDQDEREEEIRQRLADDREKEAQPVDPAVRVERREHTERQRDREREQEGEDREDDRGRQLVEDEAEHVGLEIERLPEVAAQHLEQPVEVLHQQRPIEPVDAADILDVFAAGALAGEHDGHVAGGPQQQEASADTASATRTARPSRFSV